jgi:hypothetical protein
MRKKLTQYDNFTEYMEAQNARHYSKVLELLPALKKTEYKGLIEPVGDYFAVYACDEGQELAESIAGLFDWAVITECIDDFSNGSLYYYRYGFFACNRERYFFAPKCTNETCHEVVKI